MSMFVTQASPDPRILETVKRYWGYETLRPLQEQAMRAGLDHRDSLVVLPTGGGKSLCYQVPAAIAEGGRCDIVVSPLISLMKDQVDGLVSNGYPAAALHSNLTESQRREIQRGLLERSYRLLFVAPERLLTPWFLQTIQRMEVRAFNIDEAHCISQWGHDFRPEYRQLSRLKELFPSASVHAYTATATPRVQQDIVDQLRLENPNVLVGVFDRPNLVYRVIPKVHVESQAIEVIRRHDREAVIVYCISRNDTEAMAATLCANGINAAAYHAGMDSEKRSRTQEAFAEESLDVVVATVAFGMGIDRSNVRCVIHAAMPKTVEHYQQETGRAGRDGLEAECVMFYSAGDFIKWQRLIDFSAERIEDPDLRFKTVEAQRELLEHMKKLCSGVGCRHRDLSRYFGQEYPNPNCGACDVCLGEVEGMADSTVIAQKILSCVARCDQRFGLGHIVDVLLGANTELVRKCHHDQLSTYGLLREVPKNTLQNLVYQLIDQGLLERTLGERPIVKLNADSIAVLKGARPVKLIEPGGAPVRKTRMEEISWEGVDRGLFDHLRELRRTIATERSVPAFVIFADSVLRELAAVRPTTMRTLQNVKGIGQQKLADFGEHLLAAIAEYSQQHQLATDNLQSASIVTVRHTKPNPAKDMAFEMFAQGQSVQQVSSATGRAISTLNGYLCEFIQQHKPSDVRAWVDDATYQRVVEAAMKSDSSLMRPIFEALGEQVPFEQIKIVMTHMRAVETSKRLNVKTSKTSTREGLPRVCF